MIKRVLLVGAGRMGIEYYKVLTALGCEIDVVGRGKDSAERFHRATGIYPFTGGIEKYYSQVNYSIDTSIVAVNVSSLPGVASFLIREGVKNLLIEKPAALNYDEINDLCSLASVNNTRVFVAYNRRFLASVIEARKLLANDNGISSFHFEFTELSDKVADFETDAIEKNKWFLSNSSHVADLAFYLGGEPESISVITSGALPWHESASVFAGSGTASTGALFTYTANWDSPGRWGIELMSKNFRVILKPLEKLKIQRRGLFTYEEIEINDQIDKDFKPGIYLMVKYFIGGSSSDLCTLEAHKERFKLYNRIANYT